MEVHKARAFLAVAEERNFGRAAARLHVSQPPLSRMIRGLEEDLGAALFVRGPRGVELTAVGAALVEPCRELVLHSERIRDLARRVQGGELGSVSLGFAGASVHEVVSRLVRALRAAHPSLALDLHGAQLSQHGLEQLREGKLDAIIGRWDFLPVDVASIVLAEERLLLALPVGHRLAAREVVMAEDLAAEPWVALPGGSGATLANRLHQLGVTGGFLPRIVKVVEDSATQLLMVEAGAGLALTFSGVSENIPAQAVVFRPLVPDLGAVQLRLAWRADDENPSLASLVEVAQAIP